MKMCLMAAALLVLLGGPARALEPSSIHDRPGSLTRTLGQSLDTRRWIEIDGGGVADFHLITAGDRSVLLWRRGSDEYLYEIGGPSHAQQAAVLLSLLGDNGLSSFVASREPERSDGFVKYHRVRSLKIIPLRDAG